MPSTYTTRHRLEKMATGENSNTWGANLNDAVIDLVDEALAGYLAKSVAGGSNVTLSANSGATDESRQRSLKLTGAITAAIDVIFPAVEGSYRVWNASTGFFDITLKPSGGTGIVIPQGCIGEVFTDGTTMFRSGPWIAAERDMAMPIPNLLANGECRVWQRGPGPFTSATTPANSDDTYLMDGCVLLSDGNDIVDVSLDTTVKPTGGYGSIKLDVETGSKKFGLLFPLEARDSAALIGGRASISFKARDHSSNTTLETIRVGLISWSSTADTITSDVVNAWEVAGTNPTLAANWTYENTPANIVLTSSFVEYRVNDISVDTASTANVAVFIWVDDADATIGDIIYISDVQIVPGPVATPIQRRVFADDLLRSQRYFAKTFPYATAPAQNAGVDGSASIRANSIGAFTIDWRTPVEMRVAPTATSYNPSAANSAARNINDSTDVSPTSVTGYSNSVLVLKAATTDSENDLLRLHLSATAEL